MLHTLSLSFSSISKKLRECPSPSSSLSLQSGVSFNEVNCDVRVTSGRPNSLRVEIVLTGVIIAGNLPRFFKWPVRPHKLSSMDKTSLEKLTHRLNTTNNHESAHNIITQYFLPY